MISYSNRKKMFLFCKLPNKCARVKDATMLFYFIFVEGRLTHFYEFIIITLSSKDTVILQPGVSYG